MIPAPEVTVTNDGRLVPAEMVKLAVYPVRLTGVPVESFQVTAKSKLAFWSMNTEVGNGLDNYSPRVAPQLRQTVALLLLGILQESQKIANDAKPRILPADSISSVAAQTIASRWFGESLLATV